RTDDDAALRRSPQRGRNELAGGREDDRGIELLRHRIADCSGPLGAERARKGLTVVVARTREGEDAPSFVPRDLRHDVGGGAEAVQAEPLGVPGRPQRAMADQAGAEERRRLLVGVALGNRKAEALVGDGVLGVAAVEVVAGEPGLAAE